MTGTCSYLRVLRATLELRIVLEGSCWPFPGHDALLNSLGSRHAPRGCYSILKGDLFQEPQILRRVKAAPSI